MFRFLLAFVCCFLFSTCAYSAQSPAPAFKVQFLNPGHKQTNATGYFWRDVGIFMQDAADDLNVELTITYANRNHILMKEQLNEAMQGDADYLIVVDEKKAISQWLNAGNTVTKPILFLYNAPEDVVLVKKPSWLLGYLAPNNFDAGYKLAKALYTQARIKIKNRTLNLIALYGDRKTDAATGRQHGLELFLRQYPDVSLVYSDVANWSREQGFRKSANALSHYKNIDIVWNANDAIASGVVDAVDSLKIKPAPVIGGVNWDDIHPDHAPDISVGGHVLLGAAALVRLYDAHLEQHPFASDPNVPIFWVNQPHYAALINAIQSHSLASINFARFSSTHTKPLVFSADTLNFCLTQTC